MEHLNTLNKPYYTLIILQLLSDDKATNLSQLKEALAIKSSKGVNSSIRALKELELITVKEILPIETEIKITEKGKQIKKLVSDMETILTIS